MATESGNHPAGRGDHQYGRLGWKLLGQQFDSCFRVARYALRLPIRRWRIQVGAVVRREARRTRSAILELSLLDFRPSSFRRPDCKRPNETINLITVQHGHRVAAVVNALRPVG